MAVFVSSSVLAQGNLIDNPGFDDDLSGWENPQSRMGEWSTLDASNSPLSGSALVYNEFDPSNGATPTVLQQCIAATGSAEYVYGAHIRIPPGQPDHTFGQHVVITYPTPDCSGSALQVLGVGSQGVGLWASVSDTFITDSTTASINFTIGVAKPTGVKEVAAAHFDNSFLRKSDAGGNRIIDEKLSGAWYNPATSGQGIYLEISSEVNMFIGGWYTWTEMAGEYDWMTLQGGFSGEVATLTLYRSTGGKFNDPAEVTTVAIGIAEFRFMSCTEAEFTYKFDGDSEFTVIPLIRAGPAFKGCVD